MGRGLPAGAGEVSEPESAKSADSTTHHTAPVAGAGSGSQGSTPGIITMNAPRYNEPIP